MSLVPFALGVLIGYTLAAGQRLEYHLAHAKARRRERVRRARATARPPMPDG